MFKSDIASMANSLELRAPLLDHALAELAIGLPDRLKQHGSQSKVALRQAFAADLPPEILTRGKAGFGVPISKWFRHDLRETAADVLLDPVVDSPRAVQPRHGRATPRRAHERAIRSR